jgi:hypothetical protein
VIAQPTKAPPSRAGKIALGVVLVFGALFVLMIVIGLLTSPGARETGASQVAARESAVELPHWFAKPSPRRCRRVWWSRHTNPG